MVLLVAAAILGGLGLAMALSPAAQGAGDAAAPDAVQLVEQLECDERSLTESGEVQYIVIDPPTYPAEHEGAAAPELVAADLVDRQQLAAAVSEQAAVSRAADRVDFPLVAADGRTVGIATAVEDGGWRLGGGIVCAGG